MKVWQKAYITAKSLAKLAEFIGESLSSIDEMQSVPKSAICNFQRGHGHCDKVEEKSSYGNIEVG